MVVFGVGPIGGQPEDLIRGNKRTSWDHRAQPKDVIGPPARLPPEIGEEKLREGGRESREGEGAGGN